MRERLFTMRMSEEESARLDQVARYYGLNAAGVIRMLLKREEEENLTGLRPARRRKARLGEARAAQGTAR